MCSNHHKKGKLHILTVNKYNCTLLHPGAINDSRVYKPDSQDFESCSLLWTSPVTPASAHMVGPERTTIYPTTPTCTPLSSQIRLWQVENRKTLQGNSLSMRGVRGGRGVGGDNGRGTMWEGGHNGMRWLTARCGSLRPHPLHEITTFKHTYTHIWRGKACSTAGPLSSHSPPV